MPRNEEASAWSKIKSFMTNATQVVGAAMPPWSLGGLVSIATSPQSPGGAWAKDIRNRQLNNLSNKVGLGNIIKPGDVTSLPEDQMQVLREHMMSIPNRPKSGSWTKKDYVRYQGEYAEGDDWLNKAVSPKSMIEHTLGQYGYYEDKYGNIWVDDTFDYNSPGGRGAEGGYSWLREKGWQYGSRNTHPDETKYHYKINLGNPDYGWKIMTGRPGGGLSW